MIFYKEFYVYDKSATDNWTVYEFDEDNEQGWIAGDASVTLTLNTSSLDAESWVLVYACADDDGAWKCGCFSADDPKCAKWSVQNFSVDIVVAGNECSAAFNGPRSGSCADITASSFTATWTPSSSHSVNATSDRQLLRVSTNLLDVKRGCPAGNSDCVVKEDDLPWSDDSYEVTGLEAETTYHVRAVALCSNGTPSWRDLIWNCTTDSVPGCVDGDSDGYSDKVCGGSDCNDTNSAVNPGATEICDNGDDDDCDGDTDEDDTDCEGPIDDCLLSADEIDPDASRDTYVIDQPNGNGYWLVTTEGSNQDGDVIIDTLDSTFALTDTLHLPDDGYERVLIGDAIDTGDGTLMALVYLNPSTTGPEPIKLIKMGGSLSEEWRLTIIADRDNAWPLDLFPTANGYALLVGPNTVTNATIHAISPSGTILGSHQIPERWEGAYLSYRQGAYLDGYYITGSAASDEPFIYALSSSFAEQYYQGYENNTLSTPYPRIVSDADSLYLFYRGELSGERVLKLMKIAPATGSVINDKTIQLGTDFANNDHIAIHDDYVYIAGKFNYSSYNGNRFHAKLDDNLNFIWSYVEPRQYAWFMATSSIKVGDEVFFSLVNSQSRLFDDTCARNDLQ
ncbi:hypothetical protein GOV07_03640 [Candidatus Woesearchaeota archaeon]|nr:hypothetical protein [Candidatus Woesearchaeota archaeon]